MEDTGRQTQKDVFREIPIRYFGKAVSYHDYKPFKKFIVCVGYANELGEAFRHMVPTKLVHLSYVVSSGYVLSHAVYHGWRAHRMHSVTLELSPAHHYHHPIPLRTSPTSNKVQPTVAFMDTLLWQSLASVLIPGLVINRLCAVSRMLLHMRVMHFIPPATRKWTVTAIGILTIPFIIHPIDRYIIIHDNTHYCI